MNRYNVSWNMLGQRANSCFAYFTYAEDATIFYNLLQHSYLIKSADIAKNGQIIKSFKRGL